MKSVVKLRALVIFLFAMFPLVNANAALTIEITEGVEGALPIAVVPFDWEGPGVPPEEDITGVIAADLKRSGRFAPLPKDDLLAHPHKKEDVNFQNWRILGVDNLLIGTMRGTRAGGYEIRFQLFDIFKAKQLADYSIPASAAELRFVAHQISDIVYETLTGEPGAFNTRIAYITHLKSNGKETYKLWIADADGHNPQNIFQSSHILMSPAWSSDGRQLAYVSYETGPRAGKSEVYVQDIATAKRELIAAYPGYNGAPAWSPDGKRLALTLSKIKLSDRTNYDIYIYDMRNKSLKRLTTNWADDTEPTWSPDGKYVVFTSDRSGVGKPQLYRVALDGGRPERLTFDGQYNARAEYSPDGKSLVFVHVQDKKYRIALLELESGNIQTLTDGDLDESPSFAPNGSMIIYATNYHNRGVLSAVSVDGRFKQRIPSDEGDVREPAWSPFLQKR